ncbi:ABC transporter permease [Nocardioides sp.]|uniref:ABC transporter permease n=1 Tax=Nocardioides sp. TaxID=35761 RepID=UPI00272042D2|nr:ABC transporter permease [Nocardioides sp.]MDO9457881.1 ABC transporter permease [Nocardioides sp.]
MSDTKDHTKEKTQDHTGDQRSDLWKVVAQREISTQLRSKSFLVSGAVLVLGLVAMVVVLTLTQGHETTYDVAVLDETGTSAVELGDDLADEIDDGTKLEAEQYDDAEAAEAAVRDGDVDAALLPVAGDVGDDSDDSWEVLGDDEVDTTVSGALSSALSTVVTTANADAQGVDLAALSQGAQVQERLLDPDAEDRGLRQVASFVFVLLFYITALGFGMQIAATVTQEKESRVVEILAAALPIRALLWGKVIGTSVLAIGQTVVLALVGVGALLVTGNGDALTILGPAILWYVLFFVIGFVALASFWSVAGSLAGRQQDLQATTAPLQLILFAPYIVAVTAGEGVKTIVSMLPIVSTMMMPSRLAEGDVPLWQLGVAILTTLVAAVLLVRLAARVYERTLLQTGRRISFGEAFRSRSDA